MGWLALKAAEPLAHVGRREAEPLELVAVQRHAHDRLVRAEDFHVGHLRQLQQAFLDLDCRPVAAPSRGPAANPVLGRKRQREHRRASPRKP